MPVSRRTNANPDILVWARESAGIAPEAAARSIGVSTARLASVESGSEKLTLRQLQAASNKYKRPLATFYLRQPPEVGTPQIRDFRRFGGDEPEELSPALILEMRKAQRRRQIALRLDPSAQAKVVAFPSADLIEDPENVGKKIRNWLGVVRMGGRWANTDAALLGWRSEFEARGVLVLQSSGAHAVELDEMRGFSLAEFPLPVIVLNGRDSLSGRVFTLFHEFSHLVLRRAGLCQPVKVDEDDGSFYDDDQRLEVFCNHVAGSTIVPESELLEIDFVASANQPKEWSDAQIEQLANRFRVSRESLLRRLLILGKTTNMFYRQKRDEYLEEYRLTREREREQAREEDGAPIPQPRLAVARNGTYFSRLVLEALDRDEITYSDAVDYLGIRVRHLDGVNDIVRDSALSA